MRSVDEEKETLGSLRQTTAAWLLGIDRSSFSVLDWPKSCRKKDGSYDARELVRAFFNQGSGVAISGDPLLAGGDSPALERYRLAKARLAEIELEERRRNLHPRDKVRDVLSRFATIIRRVGDGLVRKFGPEAAASISEALDECQRIVDHDLGGNGHFKGDSAG